MFILCCFIKTVCKDVAATVKNSPDEVAEQSDIIFTCTASRTALINTKIKSGTVIVALGSDQPGKRELGEKVFESENLTIVCDDIHHCSEAGETQYIPEQRRNNLKENGKLLYAGQIFGVETFRSSNSQTFVITHFKNKKILNKMK